MTGTAPAATSAHHNDQPLKRGRGRPRRDWSARSVLVMPLVRAFNGNLALKKDRDLDIIARRLGMDGPAETLESIGSGYGLTREAMRQVVKRFAREVLGGQEGVDLFLAACRKAGNEGPIPLDRVEGTDPLFAGIGGHTYVLGATFGLVEALDPATQGNLPHIREISGIPSLVPVPAKVWEEAVDETTRILRLALPDASATRTVEILSHLPAATQEAVVKVASMEDTGTEHGDIQECVRLFLEDSKAPVSLKQIAGRVAEVTGSEIKLQRVVNVANRVGVRVARGLYTVASRVEIGEDEIRAIRHLTIEFLVNGARGRQWHASEIVPLVAGRNGIRADLTPELLGFALKDSNAITSLGRMVYALTAHGVGGQRTHLRDLIAQAIEEAGRPLTRQEIKEAVTLVRGVGSGFNVTEGHGIVRLPDGRFSTEALALRHTANAMASATMVA